MSFVFSLPPHSPKSSNPSIASHLVPALKVYSNSWFLADNFFMARSSIIPSPPLKLAIFSLFLQYTSMYSWARVKCPAEVPAPKSQTRVDKQLSTPKISSASILRLAYSLSSIEIKITPTSDNSILDNLSLLEIKESHFECLKESSLSTYGIFLYSSEKSS